MTRAVRKAGVVIGFGVVALLIGLALFCSSLGLPETRVLQGLAPLDAASAVKPVAYPGIQTTSHIATIHDVEPLFLVLSVVDGGDKHGHYSTSTARTLFDSRLHPSNLAWDFRRLRLTAYIRTHYTREERKTLFLNRMYFGDQLVGVTDAAQFYFHRPVSQLDTAQAALLLGLVRRPNYYSPTKHPDRALARRNDVLDQMAANGSLSAAQAVTEKQKGLLE